MENYVERRKGITCDTDHCKDWKSDKKSTPSLEEKSMLEIRKGKTNWGDIKHRET